MRDLLVGPSVAPGNGHIVDGGVMWRWLFGRIRYGRLSASLCNGHIADMRLKGKCLFREVEDFKESAEK